LTAAHESERRGYRILHGIVDSLWITRNNEYSLKDIENLMHSIKSKTGVEMNLEGFMRWIVFLPSISNKDVSTLTHFYGVYVTGEIKVRGIAMRRGDTPLLVKKMQEEQINIFAQAKNKKEFMQLIPKVVDKMKEYIGSVENGLVPLDNLIIRRATSRNLEQYKGYSAQKAALERLKARGIKVNPGEAIEYYIKNTKSRFYQKRYGVHDEPGRVDKEKYCDLLIKATEEILKPFGYNYLKLADYSKSGVQTRLSDFVRETIAISE